ncbi:MAG: CRISPR-associated helicase Cas3' [Gemmatimonadetes bacterium]|nr:CRISPR-associated helicase Cas3' [Gemmatimonadota bacterium]
MEILGKPNQTLFGHIRDCLTVCDEMLARRKQFLQNFCERYGWDWEEVRRCIRFAVWFHDIGKASNQWQGYIREQGHSITHALPSFAIGAMSLGISGFEKSPKFAALFAILAHHLQMLHDGSFLEERNRRLRVDMPVAYVNQHFAYFRELEPDFVLKDWQTSQIDLGRVCKVLDGIKGCVQNETDLSFKVLYSLILNLLTASDNYASANAPMGGSPDNPQGTNLSRGQLPLINDQFPLYDNTPLKSLPFLPEGMQPNDMQREIVASDSDRLILNAGCGEGKTAAALLFAQKWLRESRIERIILTLPTKFTANNLYRDLVSSEKYDIPDKLVGIIHGDSREFLTQLSTEEETKGETEETNANRIAQEFENNFYAKPVTISTVDHLLMSFYHGYKYADRAFFNVASALVVFDEVHYYEGRTMEAIAEAMRRLTQLKIPHLVMTATIPTAVRQRFDQLNPGQPYPFQRAPAVISGTAKPKAPFGIARLQETPLDEEDKISKELLDLVKQNQEKRQIIFVNQVNRAKNVYLALKEPGICENLICYHSGFISRDRVKKERIIRSLFKDSNEREDDELEDLDEYNFNNSDVCVLVSTQVSELSLDISADAMYSEIAPIDSIVQRGGRLNRKGVSPLDQKTGYTSRLYLMPAYEDEKKSLPYEPDILQRSWNAIGGLYTFRDACVWVDEVYQESQPLMHNELSAAIHTDLVFGKRPQDNYAGETEEDGRVVIRDQRYQTYDVVPLAFAELVEDNYQNYKNHHLSISAGAFWLAHKAERIFNRESNQRLITRQGDNHVVPIPFNVINAKYTFEVGLQPDLEDISNIL